MVQWKRARDKWYSINHSSFGKLLTPITARTCSVKLIGQCHYMYIFFSGVSFGYFFLNVPPSIIHVRVTTIRGLYLFPTFDLIARFNSKISLFSWLSCTVRLTCHDLFTMIYSQSEFILSIAINGIEHVCSLKLLNVITYLHVCLSIILL